MLCESIKSRKAFICRSLWHLGVSDLCQLDLSVLHPLWPVVHLFIPEEESLSYWLMRCLAFKRVSYCVWFLFTGDYYPPPPPVIDTSGFPSPSSFPPPPPMDEASLGFPVRFAKTVITIQYQCFIYKKKLLIN